LRTPSRAALALALAAAACSGSRTSLSAGVTAPSAVVAFQGVTARYPDLHPYLAVASGRGGELRIIDPREDRPLLGPTLVFPLSIPTDARPLKLAAASLGDGRADLLAVALPGSAGAPAIEIVETWTAQNRMSSAIELPGLGADAEIVSLAAGPVSVLAGEPAKARLVAGLATAAGFRLAAVDVVRGADGGIAAAGPAALQPLGFTPLDLAFSPAGDLLFIATTDPVGGVLGVAQLTVGDPAAAWPVTALDARDGTTHVTAAVVVERSLTETTSAGQVVPATRENVFDGPAALRVYAALDPAGCGETKPIRCGIATLVPGGALAADPARVIASAITGGDPTQGMPYRAPIEFVGVAAALSVAPELANIPSTSSCKPSDTNPSPVARTLLSPPGTGQRCTSSTGIVASSDGNAYVLDLGRFQIPSETSVILDVSTRTRVTSAASTIPVGTTGATLTFVDANGLPISRAADLPAAVQVTPGFTPTDTFRITYQGIIPGLQAMFGVVRRLPTGELVLTGQADSGRRDSTGEVVWAEGPRLASPVFGLRAGDATQIGTKEIGVCPGDVAGDRVDTEVGVAAVLPPDAARGIPGGALQLLVDPTQPLPCFATGIDALPGKFRPVQFNVRASGLVLTGDALGYLGRPAIDGTRFSLEYQETADVPDRSLEPTTEAQLLARKARRRFYPSENACGTSGCSGYPGLLHPLQQGPMLAFGVVAPGTPPRNAELVLTTASGYLAFTARPSGAVLPVGAAAIDRSAAPLSQDLAVRWYVGYSDDQVFVFGPAEAPNQAFSIR
jgi:hypothetical protein